MKIPRNENNDGPNSSNNREVYTSNNGHQYPVAENNNANSNATDQQSTECLNQTTDTSPRRIEPGRRTNDHANETEVATVNNNKMGIQSTNNDNNNNNDLNNQSAVDRSASGKAATRNGIASTGHVINKNMAGKSSGHSNVNLTNSVGLPTTRGSTNLPVDTSQSRHLVNGGLSTSYFKDSEISQLNKASSTEDVEYSSATDQAFPDLLDDIQDSDEPFPEYLQTLIQGKSKCGDSYVPFHKPDWLDMDKFCRGQRFALDHIFGVMYAELLSLIILFAFRGGLEPLIFTGKSDTPFKAFKRYLSTVLRVRSWYDSDIWDEESLGHFNLRMVRNMHETTRRNMTTTPKDVIRRRVTFMYDERQVPLLCDLKDEIREDFHSSCPLLKGSMHHPNEVFINQFDMGLTQFGFAGLVLIYPGMFGIHHASDEDLDAFVHFWRTIGYLLGTEDKFNLCIGDLQTVQQRCRDIVEYWVKPKFRTVSLDWLHMSRCLFIGVSFYIPAVSFEVLLLYLCRVLNIQALKLKASLTFWQYVFYLQTIFLYQFTLRLPGMWRLHNWLIDMAVKKAKFMSPEKMSRLEQRVYAPEAAS